MSALLLTAVLAASCAPAGTRADEVRIGMVTDVGGLGDHSYNDMAYAGMVAAKQRFGVHIAVLQPESAAEFPPMLGSFADRGYDETFAVGYTMQVDLRETAERIPDRHFSIIDAVVDEPNVTSVTFKEEEGSFLAGAIAAMTTKTRVLGFLGGADVPLIRKFEAGYAAGAHEVDPSIRIASKYVGNFNDVATGAELTGIMFDDGADIVYAAAGKAGLGAIQLVRQRKNAFVIGVNSDQDNLAPGKILTSMLKRVDVSVYKIAELAAAHKPRPARLELGVRENGVGLTDFRYTRNVVTSTMIARLARIKAAIIDGRIVVPKTDAEAARFMRVPP